MKKVFIFLLLVLTVFTIGIGPNIGAEATATSLVGFWEGYLESRGFKQPAFIEFVMGNPYKAAEVELSGYCYSLPDQRLNLAINNCFCP